MGIQLVVEPDIITSKVAPNEDWHTQHRFDKTQVIVLLVIEHSAPDMIDTKLQTQQKLPEQRGSYPILLNDILLFVFRISVII